MSWKIGYVHNAVTGQKSSFSPVLADQWRDKHARKARSANVRYATGLGIVVIILIALVTGHLVIT